MGDAGHARPPLELGARGLTVFGLFALLLDDTAAGVPDAYERLWGNPAVQQRIDDSIEK